MECMCCLIECLYSLSSQNNKCELRRGGMKTARYSISCSEPNELRDILSASSNDERSDLIIGFGNVQGVKMLSDSNLLASKTKRWLVASSCKSVLCDEMPDEDLQLSMALLEFTDVNGSFGVAAKACQRDNAFEQAKLAVQEALVEANRIGEVPALIWCNPSPGLEEEVIDGIRSLLGDSVPIFGGTSADDDINEEWLIYSSKGLLEIGFMLVVCFPSVPVSYHFSCGYERTKYSGIITKANQRELIEIDNQPAGQVYNQWRSACDLQPLQRGAILSLSTFEPLGRAVGPAHSQMTLLSHPAVMNADLSMTLFSDVTEQQSITFMRGNEDLLLNRAAQVAEISSKQLQTIYSVAPQAGLVIFCAGCMLAVDKTAADIAKEIKRALPNIPFIGGFTFGEQGRFADGVNRHGNLMISCVTFGADNE